MCVKLRGQPDDLRTSVERARIACKLLPQHTGILHNLAEGIVQCCEEEVVLEDEPAALKEAQEILTAIIATEPNYAKFYCTKGRLEAIHHRFAEAKAYIRRAIDKEDSAKRDYAVRLSDYEAHLLSVQIRESAWKQMQRMTEIYDQVKEAQGRNLEILGFFSAVVALIIGGVQTSQRHSFLESAQLLLTLTGALLFGFAGLGLLVHGAHDVKRSVLLFVLAIFVVAFALKVLPLL
jgi:tetratricopeptide (TPR) repeat protein